MSYIVVIRSINDFIIANWFVCSDQGPPLPTGWCLHCTLFPHFTMFVCSIPEWPSGPTGGTLCSLQAYPRHLCLNFSLKAVWWQITFSFSFAHIVLKSYPRFESSIGPSLECAISYSVSRLFNLFRLFEKSKVSIPPWKNLHLSKTASARCLHYIQFNLLYTAIDSY